MLTEIMHTQVKGLLRKERQTWLEESLGFLSDCEELAFLLETPPVHPSVWSFRCAIGISPEGSPNNISCMVTD